MNDFCTCPPAPRGPPWGDGADSGPCAYCEAQAWREHCAVPYSLTHWDESADEEEQP